MRSKFFAYFLGVISLCLLTLTAYADQGYCYVCKQTVDLPHICIVVTNLENELEEQKQINSQQQEQIDTLTETAENQQGQIDDLNEAVSQLLGDQPAPGEPTRQDLDDAASATDVATMGLGSAAVGSYHLLVEDYLCSECGLDPATGHMYGCLPPVPIEVSEEIMQRLLSPITCSDCGADLSTNSYHDCNPPDYTPDCSLCTMGCSSCQRPEEPEEPEIPDYTPDCPYCYSGCSGCPGAYDPYNFPHY